MSAPALVLWAQTRAYLVSNLWRGTTLPWVALGFIPTAVFLSLEGSRSFLLSRGLSSCGETERKPLTFQAKTRPVGVAVRYCQWVAVFSSSENGLKARAQKSSF